VEEVEWLYNDVVVARSAAEEVLLQVPVVNDSLHNRQYKCRVTTPFGVLERNTTITVRGMHISNSATVYRKCNKWLYGMFVVPASAVTVFTTTTGGPVTAGDVYSIACDVRRPISLSVVPGITWVNPDGIPVSAMVNTTMVGDTTVISAAVQFSPLLVSHGGVYTCEVSLFSPSLLSPLNLSSAVSVTVQSKCNMFCEELAIFKIKKFCFI